MLNCTSLKCVESFTRHGSWKSVYKCFRHPAAWVYSIHHEYFSNLVAKLINFGSVNMTDHMHFCSYPAILVGIFMKVWQTFLVNCDVIFSRKVSTKVFDDVKVPVWCNERHWWLVIEGKPFACSIVILRKYFEVTESFIPLWAQFKVWVTRNEWLLGCIKSCTNFHHNHWTIVRITPHLVEAQIVNLFLPI